MAVSCWANRQMEVCETPWHVRHDAVRPEHTSHSRVSHFLQPIISWIELEKGASMWPINGDAILVLNGNVTGNTAHVWLSRHTYIFFQLVCRYCTVYCHQSEKCWLACVLCFEELHRSAETIHVVWLFVSLSWRYTVLVCCMRFLSLKTSCVTVENWQLWVHLVYFQFCSGDAHTLTIWCAKGPPTRRAKMPQPKCCAQTEQGTVGKWLRCHWVWANIQLMYCRDLKTNMRVKHKLCVCKVCKHKYKQFRDLNLDKLWSRKLDTNAFVNFISTHCPLATLLPKLTRPQSSQSHRGRCVRAQSVLSQDLIRIVAQMSRNKCKTKFTPAR